MHAIILAGGRGERLRPLTDTTPKPFLPIKGKPMIQHIIENMQKQGITNIILSIGYKADEIKNYLKDGSKLGVNLTYCIEDEPLGTGGAVKLASKDLTESFVLQWGDNLMDISYKEMIEQHKNNNAIITMALVPREDVENFGVAKLNQDKIIGFVEKPKREDAPSNLINSGAFIINPKALEILPQGKSSIERDCFEKLATENGGLFAFEHKGQWFPTDTIEKYNKANESYIP